MISDSLRVRIPDTNFRPSLLDCLTDLMRKLGKLRFGLTAFPEEEIGPSFKA